MASIKKIGILGAGSIGTALAHILAEKATLSVQLWSIEEDVILEVGEKHFNSRYFPKIKLNPDILATTSLDDLADAEILFLAIPSVAVVNFVEDHAVYFNQEAIFVNLAKGFGPGNRLITDCLNDVAVNPFVTLKGPSFARELINGQPTAFTLGSKNEGHFDLFDGLFNNTCIYIDHSTDLRGVELASILKNIYAIAMGIVDANFDSPNLRSLVLTRAMNEMRQLLIHFGGQEKTMFNYCGFGDFTLTALNDLSRNRTLGLLIGKGFFTADISQKVVLEGRIAVNVLCTQLNQQGVACNSFPLISELHRVFNQDYEIEHFVNRILER
jgi:glycerol-3-phosphate dehydrogenase (NAD(P)+)